MKNNLVIFTRHPTPGSAKTRLIPALGARGAADLQRQMTEHTLETVAHLGADKAAVQVRYEDGDQAAMERWLGKHLRFASQGEGDLGDRLRRTFEESFLEGFEKVVIIGSDCPSLGPDDLAGAFDLLEENTLVLGPAADGGYYLIGMRSTAPIWLYDLVFENIPWGTDLVFNTTMNVLSETGLDVGLLDEKADVDVPEDLEEWYRKVGSKEPGGRSQERSDLSVSVIIPTFNESEKIGLILDYLKTEDVEVVVADGGSEDRTLQICEGAGVRVVRSEPGRARQMNAGASGASGNVFLFLHADTRLPERFADEVKKAVTGGAVGGAFLFGTDSATAFMSIIENMAHFRTIRLGIVFGDQAIFATREAFYRAGAYPEQPIMEDYELWKRLGRVGRRTIVPLRVITSARKWERHGAWRLTLIHQAVTWLYLMGVSPERLSRWYQGKLEKTERGRWKADARRL